MELKKILDLFFSVKSQIDFFWNFYVGIVIVLAGWLISTKRALTKSLKFLITGGYLLFAFMNVLGLIRAYKTVEAIRLDIKNLLVEKGDLVNLRGVIEGYSYGHGPQGTIAIHIIMAILVFYAVWKFRLDEPSEVSK